LARWIVMSWTVLVVSSRIAASAFAAGLEQRGVLPERLAGRLGDLLARAPRVRFARCHRRRSSRPHDAVQVANELAGVGDGGELIEDSAA
jgi:hypothetical protein